MEKTERLTERIGGVAQSYWNDKTIPCGKTDWCPEGNCSSSCCDFAHIIERLAAYEDTGLLPDEVERLKAENKRLKAKIKSQKAAADHYSEFPASI